MQLCNLEGKLLISSCHKSEEDSSSSLMWFGLKKRKEVAVSAYSKPDFRGFSSAVAVQKLSAQVWVRLQRKSRES